MNIKFNITIPVTKNQGATMGDVQSLTNDFEKIVDEWCKNFNAYHSSENGVRLGAPQVSRIVTDVSDFRQVELKMEFED